MKILQPLKKFHFANPLQKSEIFDPLRKSRQRGGVYIKWNGPIPGTLTAFNNLEWCHHAVIMLKETSCNEEKIRRQQIKRREK